ncbi:uncharacterized protein [Linepithema humile]|uniref:uncharacterized protein n=1 Tax=Linepithema humile TaxID=83485 RepID=UPI00351E2ADA
MIDGTLEKLGITTDYRNLQLRIILLVLGWSAIIVLITSQEARYLKAHYDDYDTITSICIPFLSNYCSYMNFINDLIVASILGYIGLKFDQINRYLDSLTKDNKRERKRALENPLLSHQWPILFPKTARSGCMTWIVFHLHSELRKVFREVDSIFGIRMTLEMGCYFAFITLDFQEFFNVMFINNYTGNKIVYIVLVLFWICQSIFRLFFINYTCERVSIKANSTGRFINKLSHTNYDGLIHENITQFVLQIVQTPLKFCGLGLFQFGFKFLYEFFASVATVLVILIQSHTNVDTPKNINTNIYNE